MQVSWEWEIVDSFIKHNNLKPFWIEHLDINNWGKLDPDTGRWDGFFGLVGYGVNYYRVNAGNNFDNIVTRGG